MKAVTTIPTPRDTAHRQVMLAGLWHENPALVKLLGLCPLLAVSNTAINGLGLGLATLLTLVIASTSVSLLRPWLQSAVRIPTYVVVIASTVSLIEFCLQAWMPALHLTLGIFLPLIVTNCLIMGRAEAHASRQRWQSAVVDALAMGTGFLCVLVLLGLLRELIGQGTLLADAELLFGEAAQGLSMQIFNADNGILLAVLPPGAFIALGTLLALKHLIDARVERTRTHGGIRAN